MKISAEQKSRQKTEGVDEMQDVLREYLVSLGFSINTQQLNQFRNVLVSANNAVRTMTTATSAQFLTAGTAVVSFVAAGTLALGHFMTDLANTELKMQMMARQLFTSTENATTYINTLGAMGRTLDELRLSPELIKQFQELRSQALNMSPPSEYKDEMKEIRAVGFEFTRLKLSATYAMQWIGHYVYLYLETPIRNLKLSLSGINDTIQKNMPQWTQRVAQVVSWIGRLALALYSVKEAVGVVAGAFLAFKLINMATSPIGLMILGLTALLLLIDDYNTWATKDEQGNRGKSFYADTWESLTDNKVFEGIDNITGSLKGLFDEIGKVMEAFGNLFLQLTGSETFKEFGNMLEKEVAKRLRDIASTIKAITLALKGKWGEAWDELSKDESLPENSKINEAEKIDPNKTPVTGKAPDKNLTPSGISFWDFLKEGWDFFTANNGKESMSPQAYNPSTMMATPQAYINPQVTNRNQKSSLVQNTTFNVFGTEPTATASAISVKMEGINTRNFKPIIV